METTILNMKEITVIQLMQRLRERRSFILWVYAAGGAEDWDIKSRLVPADQSESESEFPPCW